MLSLIFGIIISGLCLFDIPFLLILPFVHGRRFADILDIMGLVSLFVALVVTVALHATGIPITRGILLSAYAALLCAGLAASAVVLKGEDWSRACMPAHVGLPLAMLLVSLLLAPFTNLPGIDTYKWQDLATNIRVEASIPWLVHPLSLFGFTPRSYPSAQPVLLAVAQIGGGLGVHSGYWLCSIFCVIVGLASARRLARLLGLEEGLAAVAACVYVLSPVFIRYAHWATGRGLYLAILPMFIASLLERPRRESLTLAFFSGIALALSHKAGFVTVIVLPPVLLAARWMPRSRGLAIAAGGSALLVGMAAAPNMVLPSPLGKGVGLAYFAATRFAWMLPAVIFVPLVSKSWPDDTRLRQFAVGLLITLPVAFHGRIYGAMLCLPFMAMLAVIGLRAVASRRGSSTAVAATCCALVLSIIGAMCIVVSRSVHAAPDSVRTAARLLNQLDADGPYILHAPGIARRQVQAYVTGCPRFSVRTPESSEVRIRPGPVPRLAGLPEETVRKWIQYLRNVLSVSDVETDWYGRSPRRYYVVIDGQGERPASATCVARNGVVDVYVPAGQSVRPVHSGTGASQ